MNAINVVKVKQDMVLSALQSLANIGLAYIVSMYHWKWYSIYCI